MSVFVLLWKICGGSDKLCSPTTSQGPISAEIPEDSSNIVKLES